jgi:hypothetical protein
MSEVTASNLKMSVEPSLEILYTLNGFLIMDSIHHNCDVIGIAVFQCWKLMAMIAFT